MRELMQFNWQAFSPAAGLKVAIASGLIFSLEASTDESWLVTGLVLLLAWLADIPGSLNERLQGTAVFALIAVAITLFMGLIGLALWPNVLTIFLIGLAGTLALALGMRAFLLGYVLIAWAIYCPFLIAETSLVNCMVAVFFASGLLMALNIAGARLWGSESEPEAIEEAGSAGESPGDGPTPGFVMAYALVVACVLAATTYIGWKNLKVDPTVVVAAAFFVIGFEANKTWVNGLARVIGILVGMFLGYQVSLMVDPGVWLYVIAVIAFFLCSATMEVHPGAFMLFFMFIVALGWGKLDTEMLNLTFWERTLGESVGVVVAMLAIVLLNWCQRRMK